jgi:hypothetical protein
MISVRLTNNPFGELEAELAAWPNVQFNFSPIESRLTQLVQQANKESRLAGEDWLRDGAYLKELAPSTLKGRQGSPVPFVEHGTASRVIRNLVVTFDNGPRRLIIKLNWPGCEWLAYHKTGAGRLPPRDPTGISARRMIFIDGLIVDECDRQAAQQIRNPGRFLGGLFGIGR